MAYVMNVLIAIDQVFCTLVGGYPDETLSSYAYRLRLKGKFFGFFADVIDWGALKLFKQTNHCLKAYLSERERLQLPPDLRST